MITKYNGEFRKEVIKLSDEIGVKSAGEKLGVSAKTIYNWRRNKRLKEGKPLKGMKPGETPEEAMKRLEREIGELREANTILKKAMGFLVDR